MVGKAFKGQNLLNRCVVIQRIWNNQFLDCMMKELSLNFFNHVANCSDERVLENKVILEDRTNQRKKEMFSGVIKINSAETLLMKLSSLSALQWNHWICSFGHKVHFKMKLKPLNEIIENIRTVLFIVGKNVTGVLSRQKVMTEHLGY